MATITVTNRKASQALNGQSVTVTLDATDSAQLANIATGDPLTVSSTSAIGSVYRVDTYGNSFMAAPVDGVHNLASDTPGYLKSGDTIVITV